MNIEKGPPLTDILVKTLNLACVGGSPFRWQPLAAVRGGDENFFLKYFLGVLATPLLMSPIFIFLRDVWILTQRAAVASTGDNNLATHLPNLANHLPN
jgi:hypothetical protein